MKPPLDTKWFQADHDALVGRYLDIIIDAVANHFQVDRHRLTAKAGPRKNGSQQIAELRFLCFRFARQFTGLTDTQVGRRFQRAHSVVFWGRNRCDELAAIDPVFANALVALESSLRAIFKIAAAPNPLASLDQLGRVSLPAPSRTAKSVQTP